MNLRDNIKISYSQTTMIYTNYYVFYLYTLNSITIKTKLHGFIIKKKKTKLIIHDNRITEFHNTFYK